MAGPTTNPYTVSLAADTWVQVAVDVDNITIKESIAGPKFYLIDQVDFGQPGPTNDDNAIQFPITGKISVENTVGKNFYCKAVGANGEVIVWEGCLVYFD